MKVNGASFQGQAEKLHALWCRTIPGVCPSIQQFGTWLRVHNRNEGRITWAICELSTKLTKREMSDDHKVRFVSSVMNAEARKEDAQ